MRHFCQYPLLVFFSITIIANKKSASCWQWSNLQISLLQHCLRNADVCLGSSCRLARTLQPSDLNGESNRKGDVHKWHWHFLVSLTPLGGYVSPSSSFGLPLVPHCHLLSSFWVTIGCVILRRHLWMAQNAEGKCWGGGGHKVWYVLWVHHTFSWTVFFMVTLSPGLDLSLKCYYLLLISPPVSTVYNPPPSDSVCNEAGSVFL